MVHVHCKPFPYKHERNRIHSFILQYQAMINHKIRFSPTFRRGNVVNNWSMQSWTLIFFELITLHLGQLKYLATVFKKNHLKTWFNNDSSSFSCIYKCINYIIKWPTPLRLIKCQFKAPLLHILWRSDDIYELFYTEKGQAQRKVSGER